jgi:hypothetical protein
VPLGGQRGEARRSVRLSALPSRRGGRHRLAAQRCAGAVQRRRRLSRCTDRSAGGCADRHTAATARARALNGLDAAEAAPRRCASWRSRGRWWRGPAARATARPCRLSAVPAGPLTAARPGVPGPPRGREPPPPATALRQRLAAPAGATCAAAWADHSGCHAAGAGARTRALSTRAGENGAHREANCCGAGHFAILPAGEAAGGNWRGAGPHALGTRAQVFRGGAPLAAWRRKEKTR